jgi:hypothetical protein
MVLTSTLVPAPKRGTVRSSVMALGGLAVGVGLVKYGVALHPEWARFYDVATHWPDVTSSTLIMEGDRSLLSNITAASLAGALGITRLKLYVGFQVLLALVAIALPFAMPAMRSRPAQAKVLLVFVVGGPIVPLLLSWIGGYDAIAVIGATIAVLSRSRVLMPIGWALLAFNHVSLAVAMLVFWLPMMWVLERWRPTRERVFKAALATASVLAGGLLIRVLTDAWGGSTDRLALFRSIGMDNLWNGFLGALPLTIFTVLGVGWFVLLSPQVRSTVPGRLLLIEGAVAALVLPMVAIDETRIAALALLPAVLAFTVRMDRFCTAEDLRQIWHRLWIVALVIPIPIVWEGALLYVGWGRFAEFLAVFQ